MSATDLSRAEKVAMAQALRAEGLLLREIGERMGAPIKTVGNYLNDPDLSRQRERRARYANTCVDCGALTDGSGGFAQTRQRCESCKREHQHDVRYWTPERIIAALQAWARELGDSPKATLALRAGARVPCRMAQREFGSWNAALAAAGLPVRAVGEKGRAGEYLSLCAEIRECYEAGASSAALARAYGCTAHAIRDRVRRAGGVLRKAGPVPVVLREMAA